MKMDRELTFKIAYWVNQELDIKEPLSFNHFMTQANNHGFTTHQVHNYLVQEIVNGRYYQPTPNQIRRVKA